MNQILFSQLQEAPGYTFVLGIDTHLREYFLAHHIHYSCKEMYVFCWELMSIHLCTRVREWVLLQTFKSYVGAPPTFHLICLSSASQLQHNLKYCQGSILEFFKSKQFINSF